MIKKISKLALISLGVISLSSCGNSSKDKSDDADTTITKSETIIKHGAKAENGPETFNYTVSPDTAVLGKAKEALVKVVEATSVKLQDAEGKSTGSELTVKLLITNKSTLDAKKYFSVSASDARLQLDNGISVPGTKENGSAEPEPEASTEALWKFQIPADANPSKLNFFLDGTRVSVGIMKE
ncbi:hypothetical protein [Pedobacter sp. Leaf250]|uniref:hypothetical protein n=1 Tax=Pedobacter sp. Leaf250 TaxID=2876559 RepID=UPI001E38B220|nr:hypothetical protein [Pedobacter sp. Leaf250]